MSIKVESQELQEAVADQRTRSDKRRENFEALKAQFIDQQEAHQSLQHEYAVLSEQYSLLRAKSRDIIATLQEERDKKTAEYEELRTQVLPSQKLELIKQEWTGKVEQHLKKIYEANQSELESMRGEYNNLVYSYTFLKSEYESALIDHECKLTEMKAQCDTEVSSYAEKLRLTQGEKDVTLKVQQIRQLQKRNSELEQRVQSLSAELEELQTERKTTSSEIDKVFQEQSEQLANAQAQIKSLEVECSNLSGSLESVQTELSHSQDNQQGLQRVIDQAHRETSQLKRELEEMEAKHKFQLSDLEMRRVHECLKLEENRDRILKEKQSYQTQLELLQRTVHEYEALMATKEQELDQQVQVLRENEWEKQMILEKEKVVLEKRLADEERVRRTTEEESKSQRLKLQDRLQILVSQNMALETEIKSLRAEVYHRIKSNEKADMELHKQQEQGYKKDYQCLLSQYQSLQHEKQELEGNNTELQCTVLALEKSVSAAKEEGVYLAETHQHTLDKERHSWLEENTKLHRKLEEEEARVRRITTDLVEMKNRSKKIQKHYKKQCSELKQGMELERAKHSKIETEKEAMRKSLDLERKKLRDELVKLKGKQEEFYLLLQTNSFSTDK